MNYVLVALATAPLAVAATNSAMNRWTACHPHRSPFLAGAAVAIVWIPVWLVLCNRAFGTSATEGICDAIFGTTYLFCVVFLNWFIFTITDVSMHIQLLMQLHRQGRSTKEALQAHYNKDVILGNRIPRLLELGQLKFVNGRLHIAGRSVLRGAAVCALLRRILGLPIHPEIAQHSE